MFTIDELRKEAAREADAIDLNWEKLEDSREASSLTESLEKGIAWLPTLETLYSKLISGKSVVLPEQESSLSFEEVEQYTELVAEELYAGYVLAAIKDKYDKINSIIQLSGSAE